MRTPYLDLVTTLLTAQSKGDWDAMFAVMRDDAVFELPFQKTRFEGREEIVTRMQPSVARMFGLTFSDIAVRELAEPGWVLATFRGMATMATTGRPYRQTYIAVFHFVEDKAVLFQEYMDTLHLAVTCGQVEPVA